MNPIEFVSAGAGSGKTYRLTTILADALADGSARASGVAAMTFTIKAGAELRQRARFMLLGRGRLDLSTAIGQARVGTVNAVCNQLLHRFCFELGHSPDQTVLSEGQTTLLLRRALEEVLDATQREGLVRYCDRFDLERDDWDEPVRKILEAGRAHGIGAAQLQAMGPANADAMLASWPEPDNGAGDCTAQLRDSLDVAHDAIEKFIETRKAEGYAPQQNTLKGLEEIRMCRKSLDDDAWKWKQWVSLTQLDAGAKLRSIVQPCKDAAAAHLAHPEFHKDVRQYLALVFELAASALAIYEEAKRAAGAQDFTDQEMLLLRALQESEPVRLALAEELDLVLVDEFQDTSPIQLAVFVELAKLAKRSVWVGDPKQAIYGFRGTDAGLITSVLDAIPSWGGFFGAPLTQSRRSVPALVRLTNQLFTPAFPKLAPDAIRLSPVRADHPTQAAVIVWRLESFNIEQDFRALGPAIAELLDSDLQVQDRDSHAWRSVAPGDIAVLCRYNYQIPQVAGAPHHWNVPCISTRPGLLCTPEATLVLACLRRMHDPFDAVATAQIVSLTQSVPAGEWLTGRLQHVRSGATSAAWRAEGTDAHPLVARLETLRGRLAALTPFEALDLAKAESGVWRAAAEWSSTPKEAAARVANVEALLRMAAAYEDDCRSSKRPATVAGLLQWLAERLRAGDDARAAATSGAVEVVTHHSAKGLEWPVVVLTGLDAEARSGLWDVRARTDGAFDAQVPLYGRFVHYWPRPYGKRRMPDVLKTAQGSALGVQMQEQATDEHHRLLYVSATRARDAMVLMVKNRSGATTWLDGIDGSKLLFEGEGDIGLADGSIVTRSCRTFSLAEIQAVAPAMAPMQRRWLAARAPRAIEHLWLRPSTSSSNAYGVDSVERVGKRVVVNSSVDMNALGSAVHNLIAFYLSSAATATTSAAAAIFERWGVGAAVESDAVLAQAGALLRWVEAKWPGARLYVEAPIEAKLPSGRIVRGQIDLLVETSGGWILVDHKADPRSTGGDDCLAHAHGAQLEAYAEALIAIGRPVVERWLFLPVAGQMAKIGCRDAAVEENAVNAA